MGADQTLWAEDPGLVTFYECHRNRPEHLYPSERRFLPWLAAQAGSVLDVGCATGGFSNVWRHFRPGLSYAGVDVSAPLLARARELHPDLPFLMANCADGLPLAEAHSDVVQALGWLHWEPRYATALVELWRVTRRWLFFDVRLVEGEDDLTSGTQRLSLVNGAAADAAHETPYICCAWPRLTRLLVGLQPATVLGYGYWGPPADSVQGVDRQVCFATFVLERGPATGPAAPLVAALDLPLDWPDAHAGYGASPVVVPLEERVPAEVP